VLSGLHRLCSTPNAERILEDGHVTGILIGTVQAAWKDPSWTEAEIRELKGTRLVAHSKDTFLLVPDLRSCQ
jgi:hypothetical protein